MLYLGMGCNSVQDCGMLTEAEKECQQCGNCFHGVKKVGHCIKNIGNIGYPS